MITASGAPTKPYGIAGCVVLADADEPWLQPFRLPGGSGLPSGGDAPADERRGPLIYEGPGFVGGASRRVVCNRTRTGFFLEVDGASGIFVGGDGNSIVRHAPACSPPHGLDTEALFGPALILALALRGVFCFHASGVKTGDHGALFLGRSGAGKSTLARFAAKAKGWERLGDDVLPCSVDSAGAFVAPRFPQLKLSAEEQWDGTKPERVPLRIACQLTEPASEAEPGIRLRPGGTHDAFLRLVQLTVASRLFDRHLTERHLAFCESLARLVPFRELSYPRTLDVLPQVYAALRADVEAVPRATGRNRAGTAA